MIAEASGLYIPDPKLGTFSVFPNLSAGLAAFIPLNPLPVLGQNGFLLGLFPRLLCRDLRLPLC